MIKEAIEKIVSMAAVKELEIGGQKYVTQKLYPVRKEEPEQNPLSVNTLTGLIDYIKENHDDIKLSECILHIENYNGVVLRSKVFGECKQREAYIDSHTGNVLEQGFTFDRWYQIPDFIIALQSCFVINADLKVILELVSNIKAAQGQEYTDTGFSQNVTVKKGVSMLDEQKVPNPVILAPYRTFLEVDQPESPFVFRLQSGGEGKPPMCTLVEASGGQWKLQAIHKIKEWLEKQELGVTIIA